MLAEPLNKLEWREYMAATPPLPPPMPSFEEYLQMTPLQKRRFNRARDAHHSAGELVETPVVEQLHHELDRRLKLNRYQVAGARRGKVIDGPPTIGKSTLIKWFAANFERELREDEPEKFVIDEGQEYSCDYVPVVYISIGAQFTPKDLSMAIADFLMLPYRATATKTQLTNLVLKAMRLVKTELVIFDDVHFLDLSAKEGQVVNDHLKDLANKTAATFVYTGHDLQLSGLFLEGGAATRATQTAGRNDLCHLGAFKIDAPEQIQQWRTIIAAMENSLLLFKHAPGSLTRRHWSYLHDRAGGSIASLSHLIRESAIQAVADGSEALTVKLMETIVIDQRGQEHYNRTKRKKQTRRRSTGTNPTSEPEAS
ncbi:TniB family NTP-binding protein [Nocardia salmonicida]|uniref:TniB family NTP-binding protein n=1 Tax=Nocardia salmonicida TaxID=53431 RepID=UPI0013F4F770|nr:TniB family NTP-binding protein [Nocardia salmonicida]